MKTTVDECGRIQLPESLRTQMGLKTGDEVVLENAQGQWVLKPVTSSAGLKWEGALLVHHGHNARSVEETLAELREERLVQQSETPPA